MKHRLAYGSGLVLVIALLVVVSFFIWPNNAKVALLANAESSDMDCVDTNGNGAIDKAEVIAVINLYLFGPAPGPTPTPTGDGTKRSTAWPYGQKFSAGNFDMQIVEVDTDAWPEILDENQFNDPPGAGNRFVMWSLWVKNVRGSVDEAELISDSAFDLVGSRGVQYNVGNSCGVIPDDLHANLYLNGLED